MNKKYLLVAFLGLIIIGLSIYTGIKVTSPFFNHPDDDQPGVVTDIPDVNPDEEKEKPSDEQEQKEYASIVFIGKNANGEEVYKIVKREFDENIDGSKLRYAISSLVLGPKPSEKQSGMYSEVPTSTQILHVYDKGDYMIVDLSSGFAYDGGTESLYKRLFQLIKTVKRNTDKPTYLYIDGKQADVIGGDGIMITQPLSENSIGE